MTTETNIPCPQCFAEPGEMHRDWDDIARCALSGQQLIACDRDHNCRPGLWDGEYPGVKQCRELGWYTPADSIWGETEDLNTLFSVAMSAKWDVKTQKYIISDGLKNAVDRQLKKRRT